MLGAEPALADTPEYAMLPRQLRVEARRLLRPVPTPVEPSPMPVNASPNIPSILAPTTPTHNAGTPEAPPPTTPARPNMVKSKGGVLGAKTLLVAPPCITSNKEHSHDAEADPEGHN